MEPGKKTKRTLGKEKKLYPNQLGFQPLGFRGLDIQRSEVLTFAALKARSVSRIALSCRSSKYITMDLNQICIYKLKYKIYIYIYKRACYISIHLFLFDAAPFVGTEPCSALREDRGVIVIIQQPHHLYKSGLTHLFCLLALVFIIIPE